MDGKCGNNEGEKKLEPGFWLVNLKYETACKIKTIRRWEDSAGVSLEWPKGDRRRIEYVKRKGAEMLLGKPEEKAEGMWDH